VTGPPTTATEATVQPVPAARVVFSADDRREIASRIDDALQSGALTLGKNTIEFEDAFATAHRSRYAIAVTSGTAALEIILRSLDVAGREVVIPANTFAATAFAVIHAGGIPVFADISPTTAALTAESVRAVLSERTAAVVVVHIAGFISAHINGLRELCDEHEIALVEDAAHAHGGALDGICAGSFGIAGAFSFYPTKVITSGEGGMIVTSDERIRDEALCYRDQGKAGFHSNQNSRLGYAWRMSELHAAVGLVHFRHLHEFIDSRERIAARYMDGLAPLSDVLTPLTPAPRSRCNYYKFPVVLADGLDRAALKARLKDRGINLSGEVYDTPLHLQPVFANVEHDPLPGAEHFCARHICLPVHSDMTDDEVDRVLAALADELGGA